MKFKYQRQVIIGFKSGTMITVFCDQISFREGFYNHLVFQYKGIEVCNCIFDEVESICYFAGLFAIAITPIDKNKIKGGDLVEA